MKKLILILVAVLLVGGIAGGAFLFLGRKSARAAKPVDAEPRATTTVELDEFLVNLADMGDQHYMKATLALEVEKSPENEAKLKEATPRVRDAVITAISKRHFRELLTVEGKQSLKSSIRASINGVLGGKVVTQVYFTSLAMQ